MQAPGGPDEDRSGKFQHGGWLVPYADPDMGGVIDEAFAVAELKRRHQREIVIQGSSELLQTLLADNPGG